jgi:hypothetical protein
MPIKTISLYFQLPLSLRERARGEGIVGVYTPHPHPFSRREKGEGG